jgi:hypothetical protein
MSNWIDYNLDVLAGSTAEINQITEKLNQPSLQLAGWIAQRDGQQLNQVTEGLKKLLEFKTVRNLGHVHDEINKARRFTLAFKDKHWGIVDSHLAEISEAFPNAIFLPEYSDIQASYSGKRVMRARKSSAGGIRRRSESAGPGLGAAGAEYHGEEHDFGSLWTPWLDAVSAAVNELKHKDESPLPELPNVAGQQVNVTEVWSCLIPDCSNVGAHRAPGAAPKDRLCCEHYEQFIAHLFDPLGNPTFPK